MIRRPITFANALTASLFALAIGSSALGAEITFLCASALKPAMEQLINDFQSTTGHNVNVVYANIGTITKRIRKGEGADIAILSPQQWGELKKESKIASDFRVQFARVGVGVAIKKGGEKPDVRSAAAVKAALKNARIVAVTDPATGSPSGAYVKRLFDRLGITDEMKSRQRLVADHLEMFNVVEKGEADFGINQASLVATAVNVELAGMLPAELQGFTVFVAGIPKTAKQSEVAKLFVKFLSSPSAAVIMKTKGLEPG